MWSFTMDHVSCRGRRDLCCEMEEDILKCDEEIDMCECLILEKPKNAIYAMYAGKFFAQDCTHFKTLGGSCGEFELFFLLKKFARNSIE